MSDSCEDIIIISNRLRKGIILVPYKYIDLEIVV